MLDFSSTAYLALDRHPHFRDWVNEGFDRYGLHYGGSRLAPGVPDIFAATERKIAGWLQTEAALLVSSGSLAAAWVRDGLQRAGWRLHFAPTVHAAWLPERPAVAEVDHWLADLAAGRPTAWLADSLDPIAVARPDLPSVPEAYPAAPRCWVLDESHAIGLLGPAGAGLAPECRSRLGEETLAVGSLGKAFSLPAGFIAGSQELLTTLRTTSRFGGAAPPNAAFIYAFSRAGDLIRQQRETLGARLDYLLRRLPLDFALQTIPQHPALRCLAGDFHAFAQREGIRLSHFAYPTADAEPVTRIVLNAGHTYRQIDTLLGVIDRFLKRG